MKYIDISLTIDKNLPHWPTENAVKVRKIKSIVKGDKVNITQIDMSVHTGTHVDAPTHFVKNGKAIDQLPLDRLIGKCYVCNVKNSEVINIDFLKNVKMSKNIKKLLFKTKNSNLWGKKKKFFKNYVALTADAAKWLVKKGIDLVGIDYLSIGRFDKENTKTHKILLKKGVVVVEGLNLKNVNQGIYELIILPIKIKGSDGAPARAILKIL